MPKYDNKDWPQQQLSYQREAVRRAFWRCCLNCDHYHDGKAVVGIHAGKPAQCLKFGALPPPEVVVFGCDHYEEVIPF